MRLWWSRLLVALLCAPVMARARGGEAHWLRITSPNFEVYTDAGERAGRDVARHFEQVRSFFLDAMGLGSKPGEKVSIVVFRLDKEFAPYAPTEFASAFYHSAGDQDYIVMKSAASDRFHVAVHEYTHLLVRHTGIQAPIWFNEGLAEFYSNLKPVGGQVEVGDMIMPHVTMLRQSKWIDLPTLLAVEHDSPLYNVKTHAGLFYAESWALVHMLYLGEEYRSKLPALLDQIKSGTPMAEAFPKIYGKNVERVEQDLRASISAQRFTASLFHVKLAPAAEAPGVAEPDPEDACLVLAEIMASMPGKAGEGRAAYERLAHDYPKDWRVEEGLARVSRRERNRAEAIAHYARAAELGSTNAPMYLEYGRLLRAADKPSEAVTVLKRGTEIDPNDHALHLELGFAYLINDQHAEALTQFQLAKPVTEERAFEYFHAMAYAYYRLDRKSEARAAAASSRPYAKTAEQAARLDQLVAALDYEPQGAIIRQEVPVPPRHPETAPAEPPKPREELPVAEGTLKQIDCAGGQIRMHILAGSKMLSFAMNPAAVTIQNSGPVDFTCGPQSPKRVRIRYRPAADAPPGTLGAVRTIEFPK